MNSCWRVCQYFIFKQLLEGLCDIRNNQGRGKCYQPNRRSRLITITKTLLIFADIRKAKSNIIVLLYKKTATDTPSQGTELTLFLEIMHYARNKRTVL